MKVPENAGEEHEDHHDDHTETAPYCGKTLRAYESGWFEGDTECYNENICKYYVSFNDGPEDYIGKYDIGMIEVIVL